MDWDLQAIVRCSSEAPATIMDNPHRILSQYFCSEQEDQLFNFQEFSETASVVDELEELYKPFYPSIPNNSLPIVTNSRPIPEEVKVLKPSNQVAVQDLQDPVAYKCKKSKKKEKNKRVKHVVTGADGVSDPWAWRKYGQKPIKGSPYPRSYYRCSSSKGCLARKQVEQSHLDPEIFIVTYTAEHSDPHPPRKNSRASKNSSAIAPPTVKCEQSNGLKKEEEFLEGDGWFPSVYRA